MSAVEDERVIRVYVDPSFLRVSVIQASTLPSWAKVLHEDHCGLYGSFPATRALWVSGSFLSVLGVGLRFRDLGPEAVQGTHVKARKKARLSTRSSKRMKPFPRRRTKNPSNPVPTP